MKKTFIGSKGFTLIELVLVIGILAVISVIVLTVLDPIAQFQKANDAKIKSDLSQIQKGLENYYNDNNVYPDSSDVSTNYEIISGGEVKDWGSVWNPYMDYLPQSPGSPDRSYVYYSPSPHQAYYLYANVERSENKNNINEPFANLPGDAICAKNVSGGGCNYGVSSPNVSP